MLELVFDQSLAGAMRQAKGHSRGTVVSRGVKIYMKTDDTREQVHGLGQFPPETLGDLATDAVRLPPELRRQYGDCWLELVKENASLRAVVNGTLMSVPEEFYDVALRKNLPVEEPKRIGCVLAETLRQTPGIGDTWLYLRLMKLVGKGEVEIAGSPRPDHPYSAMIQCKTGCQRSREGPSGK